MVDKFVPTGHVDLGFTLPMGDYASLKGSIGLDFRYDQPIEPQLEKGLQFAVQVWKQIDDEIEVLVVDSANSIANKPGMRVRVEDLERQTATFKTSLRNVADEVKRQKGVLAERLQPAVATTATRAPDTEDAIG